MHNTKDFPSSCKQAVTDIYQTLIGTVPSGHELLAMQIVLGLTANTDNSSRTPLVIAAGLHDIGKHVPDLTGKHHSLLGASLLSGQVPDLVTYLVLTHTDSHWYNQHLPEFESMVLSLSSSIESNPAYSMHNLAECRALIAVADLHSSKDGRLVTFEMRLKCVLGRYLSRGLEEVLRTVYYESLNKLQYTGEELMDLLRSSVLPTSKFSDATLQLIDAAFASQCQNEIITNAHTITAAMHDLLSTGDVGLLITILDNQGAYFLAGKVDESFRLNLNKETPMLNKFGTKLTELRKEFVDSETDLTFLNWLFATKITDKDEQQKFLDLYDLYKTLRLCDYAAPMPLSSAFNKGGNNA